VSSSFSQQLSAAFRDWWREQVRAKGAVAASSLLLRELWSFLRDSTPERRRQRYGDMEYDWEQRVNTTSGTVGWQARLLGIFHSPYQPTDPVLFREMMAALPIDFRGFTFIDIGSGKGRTLLMASEYPFHRIIGVEVIAELHRAAEENIVSYLGSTQRSDQREPEQAKPVQIESVLADAREFEFPKEPLVLYLFNPLPEHAFSEMLRRLEMSLEQTPRPVWVVYHNPLLERVLLGSTRCEKVGGTEQYSIYAFRGGAA
jgi:hypothetical protein